MSATRWTTVNLINWMDSVTNDNEMDIAYPEWGVEQILPHLHPNQTTDPENKTASDDSPHPNLPEILPILPLRGLVVYPETGVPLTIGQPRSIRLVDDVVAGEVRLIGLVASQNPELEIPEPKDLFQVGTVAQINRMFRAPDGTIRLLVQGMARFRLGEFIQIDPYLKATIYPLPELIEEGIEVEALARNTREQIARI
jgi:ATP-dependent Lon protease